jgi:hypothetical protein
MARHDPKARPEQRERKPHHIHALNKASAENLHRQGLIDDATHGDIMRHAEAGMKRAKRDVR